MDAVDTLTPQLDKAVATLVVSHDHRTKMFIGELVLSAVAIYLLKRYADKYLEGLGFDEIAKRHGRLTRTFIDDVRAGKATKRLLGRFRKEREKVIDLVKAAPLSPEAMDLARADLVEVFVEAGAVRGQAEDEASKVTTIASAEIVGPPQ